MTSSAHEDEDVTEEIGNAVSNMTIHSSEEEVNLAQQQQQRQQQRRQQQQQSLQQRRQQQHRRPPTPTSKPIIICDAWYGFPHQKRPRKERVNAVCKQIFNFYSWRNEYYNNKGKTNGDTDADPDAKLKNPLSESECKVYVIGRGNDIQAIEKRMGELLRDARAGDGDGNGNGNGEEQLKDALSKCSFLQDQSLEDLVRTLKSESGESAPSEFEAGTGTGRKGTNSFSAVYLSPDVETRLATAKPPPRIVVVGMLVDRKVQANRSKQRVESLETTPASASASASASDPDVDNSEQATETETETKTAAANNVLIEGARLPLEVLNVSDLGTDEPLNIDTVMEMMQRWWFNLDIHSIDTSISNVNSETRLTYICKDALARSMLTHRQRHPNRTIHGGASTK